MSHLRRNGLGVRIYVSPGGSNPENISGYCTYAWNLWILTIVQSRLKGVYHYLSMQFLKIIVNLTLSIDAVKNIHFMSLSCVCPQFVTCSHKLLCNCCYMKKIPSDGTNQFPQLTESYVYVFLDSCVVSSSLEKSFVPPPSKKTRKKTFVC